MVSDIGRAEAGVAGGRGRRNVMLGLLVLVLGAGSLCGCRGWQQAWMDKIVAPEDDQLAREMIERLQSRDLDFVVERIGPSVLGDDPMGAVQELYDYLDHEACKSVELVGCNVVSRGDHRRSDLTYQLEYPDSWYVAGIVIQTVNGDQKVLGFHLDRLAASLEELNAFSFRNKGAAHYLTLILAVSVPLFIVFALVVCIRTKVRLKALWIIFILLGVGKVSLNWATGQLITGTLLSFHVQLLGAGVFRAGPYAPWVLSVSFPQGAVLFLLLRKRLSRKPAVQVLPPLPDASASNQTCSRSGSVYATRRHCAQADRL